jgi:hypothetical protein
MPDYENISQEDSEFVRIMFDVCDELKKAKRTLRDVREDTASLILDIEGAEDALLRYWEIEPSALETMLLVFKRAEKALKSAHKACRKLEGFTTSP